MKRIITKLKELYKRWRWEPDYSNPDDIRFLVIKESGFEWDTLVGNTLIVCGFLELIGLLIGTPAIVEYSQAKIEAGESLFWAWLPPLLIINGMVLSAAVIIRGMDRLGREDKLLPIRKG